MDGFDLRQEFENVIGSIIDFLPNLLAALIILILGYIIAKALANLTRRVLQRLRFDRSLHSSPAGNAIARVVESPTQLVSRIIFWLLMIGAISIAASALQIVAINDFLGAVYGYVPHIIAAILIFLIASAISVGGDQFVQRVMGRTPLSKVIMTAIPAVVMSLAVFMILSELGIAQDIVNILFAGIVGSLALGSALAFGLGGSDVARGILENASDRVRSNAPRVKNEIRQASDDAGRESQRARDKS